MKKMLLIKRKDKKKMETLYEEKNLRVKANLIQI